MKYAIMLSICIFMFTCNTYAEHTELHPLNFNVCKAFYVGFNYAPVDVLNLNSDFIGLSLVNLEVGFNKFNFFAGLEEIYSEITTNNHVISHIVLDIGMDYRVVSLPFAKHGYFYSGPGAYFVFDDQSQEGSSYGRFGLGFRFPIGIEYYDPPTRRVLDNEYDVRRAISQGYYDPHIGSYEDRPGIAIFLEVMPFYRLFDTGINNLGVNVSIGFRGR